MNTPYGATKVDWFHFDMVLGLTKDLLPVVSDPNVPKSPNSTIKDTGKLPSVINYRGQMAGFKDWTDYVTTPEDIEKWSEDDRIGICIQTRHLRAIDVDIEDEIEAFEVENAIIKFFGKKVPCRRRAGASKFLIPVYVEGKLTKRRLPTKSGEKNFIEFLANGQQFVAFGTHPKGMKYEWDGGLPADFPTLELEEFEALWSKLCEEFGNGESVTVRAGVAPSKARRSEDIDDPVYDYLIDHWTTHGTSTDGRLDIVCPFADGHSTDSGPTSTSYYPAGVGGFERGHFKCLHTSCAHRVDHDYLNAVGYTTKDFEDISEPAVATPAVDSGPLPDGLLPHEYPELVEAARLLEAGFERTNKDTLKPTRNVVNDVISSPVFSRMFIGMDTFREEVMLAERRGQWRPFRDTDYMALGLWLENPRGAARMEHIPTEILRNIVAYHAEKNSFDSAQMWLTGLTWDGVPRVETFLAKYMQAGDTPYTRAVSRYWWTALAGRVMKPGIKADMIPLAVGDQGARKTSAVEAMSPSPEYCGEIDLSKSDDDLARDIRGKLVVEIGELKGINKRDIEHLKAFITRRFDKWTPKYKEYQTSYSRRCVFFGTANGDEPLPADDTGNRRWLPFNVESGKVCDVEGIERDRDQLWAEGLVMLRRNENHVMWYEAEQLAKEHLAKYEQDDPWVARIFEWLYSDDMGDVRPVDSPLHVNDIAAGALSIPAREVSQAVSKRIGGCLKRLGMYKSVAKGKKVWIMRQ